MKGGLKDAFQKHYQGNLKRVWNTLFKKRLTDQGYLNNIVSNGTVNFHHNDTDIPKDKNYVLFVIDMQKDFVDEEYKRFYEGKERKEETNITVPAFKTGNFAVAQASTMYKDLEKKIDVALKDEKCKKIYFSRDYHPVGHMSFSHALSSCTLNNKSEPNPDGKYCDPKNKTGCFPAHCVQCHSGSLLIDTISKKLHNLDENVKEKVEIIFKGIHKDCDSFTAVEKKHIDSKASNLEGSKLEGEHLTCSNVSGSYSLKNKTLDECIDFIDKLDPVNKELCEKTKFDFTNIDNIEVCGLAGDYCVRDTVVALAEHNKNKNVILLANLTRYAVLPLFTMRTLPQHVDEDSQYIFKKESGDITPESELSKELGIVVSKSPLKSIRYYVLNNKRLMDVDTEEFNKVEQFINSGIQIGQKPEFEHFITDEKYIIKDYNKHDNIYIHGLVEKEYVVNVLRNFVEKGGRRTRKRSRRRSKKRSSKKRSKKSSKKSKKRSTKKRSTKK